MSSQREQFEREGVHAALDALLRALEGALEVLADRAAELGLSVGRRQPIDGSKTDSLLEEPLNDLEATLRDLSYGQEYLAAGSNARMFALGLVRAVEDPPWDVGPYERDEIREQVVEIALQELAVGTTNRSMVAALPGFDPSAAYLDEKGPLLNLSQFPLQIGRGVVLDRITRWEASQLRRGGIARPGPDGPDDLSPGWVLRKSSSVSPGSKQPETAAEFLQSQWLIERALDALMIVTRTPARSPGSTVLPQPWFAAGSMSHSEVNWRDWRGFGRWTLTADGATELPGVFEVLCEVWADDEMREAVEAAVARFRSGLWVGDDDAFVDWMIALEALVSRTTRSPEATRVRMRVTALVDGQVPLLSRKEVWDALTDASDRRNEIVHHNPKGRTPRYSGLLHDATALIVKGALLTVLRDAADSQTIDTAYFQSRVESVFL